MQGLAIGGAMLAVVPAFAQGLPDPTRPPVALSDSGQQAAEAAAPVLQSVLISPSRRLAIIDGQTVRQGEKFGASRVVKITETEVVLRGGGGNGNTTQILKLFPQVEKRPAASRDQPKAGRRQ